MISLDNLSNEAVTPRYDRSLAIEFMGYFENLFAGQDIVKNFNGIEKAIKKHTNMSVTLTVVKKPPKFYQVLALLPQLPMSTNPILSEHYETIDSLEVLERIPTEVFTGTVDETTCTVSGVFSKLEAAIIFSDTMFDGYFTPEELTAMLFHELNHIWTAYFFMGETLLTDYILYSSANLLPDGCSKEQIMDVAKVANKVSGGNLQEGANVETLPELFLLITANQEVRTQDRLNCKLTGSKLSERLADQFAARFHVAKGLVTALGKMERNKDIFSRAREYDPAWLGIVTNFINISNLYYAGSVATAATTLAKMIARSAAITFGIDYFLHGTFEHTGGDHDTTVDRVHRIRRDLYEQLKDRDLPELIRKHIVSDIAAIDKEINDLNKYGSVFGVISDALVDIVRGRSTVLSRSRTLESLASNPLFLAAEKLR